MQNSLHNPLLANSTIQDQDIPDSQADVSTLADLLRLLQSKEDEELCPDDYERALNLYVDELEKIRRKINAEEEVNNARCCYSPEAGIILSLLVLSSAAVITIGSLYSSNKLNAKGIATNDDDSEHEQQVQENTGAAEICFFFGIVFFICPFIGLIHYFIQPRNIPRLQNIEQTYHQDMKTILLFLFDKKIGIHVSVLRIFTGIYTLPKIYPILQQAWSRELFLLDEHSKNQPKPRSINNKSNYLFETLPDEVVKFILRYLNVNDYPQIYSIKLFPTACIRGKNIQARHGYTNLIISYLLSQETMVEEKAHKQLKLLYDFRYKLLPKWENHLNLEKLMKVIENAILTISSFLKNSYPHNLHHSTSNFYRNYNVMITTIFLAFEMLSLTLKYTDQPIKIDQHLFNILCFFDLTLPEDLSNSILWMFFYHIQEPSIKQKNINMRYFDSDKEKVKPQYYQWLDGIFKNYIQHLLKTSSSDIEENRRAILHYNYPGELTLEVKNSIMMSLIRNECLLPVLQLNTAFLPSPVWEIYINNLSSYLLNPIQPKKKLITTQLKVIEALPGAPTAENMDSAKNKIYSREIINALMRKHTFFRGNNQTQNPLQNLVKNCP